MPETDDRALFEKLILDGFQAGLSWITILRKRENFRRALDGFEPEIIARYGPEKLESLMQDAGIVRNRAKIAGLVPSARAYLAIRERQGFARHVWSFVDGKPVQTNPRTRREVPAENEGKPGTVEGSQGAGLRLLRADHRLCLHAGLRAGE